MSLVSRLGVQAPEDKVSRWGSKPLDSFTLHVRKYILQDGVGYYVRLRGSRRSHSSTGSRGAWIPEMVGDTAGFVQVLMLSAMCAVLLMLSVCT
jgi:hypothetical protein